MSRGPVVVSVAVGARYQPYADRLEGSLRGPGGYRDDLKIWRDTWPPGSPAHADVNYAFKVHAVQWAIRSGYSPILWLDSTCHAVACISPIFDRIHRDGIFLIHGLNLLGEWASDYALRHFGVDREALFQRRLPLLSGTVLGFLPEHPRTSELLRQWVASALPALLNASDLHGQNEMMRSLVGKTQAEWVSDDPRVKGHSSDETCMSIIADRLGIPSVLVGDLFAGGLGHTPNECIRSGYDLP